MSIFGQMKLGLALCCLWVAPADAFPCLFETECYDTEVCTDAAFAVEVDADGRFMGTEFGDLPVTFMAEAPEQMTLVSTGAPGAYLMTVTPVGARLAMHGEGPFMVNYAGTCEGAF